ncbi:MAG: cytochrome c oxidase subunit 4 [Nocardioides sp.]
MKVETWIFLITTGFFLVMTPVYWFSTSAALPGGGDWTGTVALACTLVLTLMISLYLGFHARKMDARPEDDREAEIADGAGELGFFPPYSWWPLWCAMALAACVYGIAIGAWWLFIIGAGLGLVAVSGLIFEFYRGEHAH